MLDADINFPKVRGAVMATILAVGAVAFMVTVLGKIRTPQSAASDDYAIVVAPIEALDFAWPARATAIAAVTTK